MAALQDVGGSVQVAHGVAADQDVIAADSDVALHIGGAHVEGHLVA